MTRPHDQVEALVLRAGCRFSEQSHHVLAKSIGTERLVDVFLWLRDEGSVVNYQHFRSLYEQCMEEVNHVPPERRSVLLEIAATFNRLASECAPGRFTPCPGSAVVRIGRAMDQFANAHAERSNQPIHRTGRQNQNGEK